MIHHVGPTQPNKPCNEALIAVGSQVSGFRVDKSTVLDAYGRTVGARRDSNKSHLVTVLPYSKTHAIRVEEGNSTEKFPIIQLIDRTTGKVVQSMQNDFAQVSEGDFHWAVDAVQVLSDDQIAVGAANGRLLVWNPRTHQVINFNEPHGQSLSRLNHIAELPNGLVVSGDGRWVNIWNPMTGKTREIGIKEDGELARAFALDAFGNLVVESYFGFHVYDGITLRSIKTIEFEEKYQGDHPTALIKLNDGRFLEQTYSGRFRIWNLTNTRGGSIRPELDLHAHPDGHWHNGVIHHPDGYLISRFNRSVMGSNTYTDVGVHVFNSSTGQPVGDIILPDIQTNTWDSQNQLVNVVALPNHAVATVQLDGTVKFWDIQTRKQIGTTPQLLRAYFGKK